MLQPQQSSDGTCPSALLPGLSIARHARRICAVARDESLGLIPALWYQSPRSPAQFSIDPLLTRDARSGQRQLQACVGTLMTQSRVMRRTPGEPVFGLLHGPLLG
jgi:hypothetical protein